MPPDYVGTGTRAGASGASPPTAGKGGRPRLGMTLSSGSREPGTGEGPEERGAISPASPATSQMASEKSRQ